MSKLWETLANGPSDRGLWTRTDGEFRYRSWAECVSDARRTASALRLHGVGPRVPVACVLTNSLEACTTLMAIWFAGGRVISLPGLGRGMDLSDYVGLLVKACEQAGAELLIVDEEFRQYLDTSDRVRATVLSYQLLKPGVLCDPDPPGDDEVAFVQYSSGSTGDPKGCMISTRAIAAQLPMLIAGLDADASDTEVVWVPLSHDMGLFGGLLLPWVLGAELVMGTPQRFLKSPRTWLSDCAEFRGTITVVPNFALDMVVRRATGFRPTARAPLRACVVSSERIEWRSLLAASRTLGEHGLTWQTLVSAYGLGEATLAVTMSRPGELSRIVVEQDHLLEGEVVPIDCPGRLPISVTGVGRPLPGASVRIADGAEVGEILVSSPSLATGYVDAPAHTRSRFADGELRTGDIGFIRDGQLYVVGRTDDVMSIAGRNISARDVECRMGASEGVRPGNCVLVDVHQNGQTELVAVAEPAEDADFDGIALRLRKIVMAGSGVRLKRCVFMRRGSLPKTPSGKIQRFRCRRVVLERSEAILCQVEL